MEVSNLFSVSVYILLILILVWSCSFSACTLCD